MLADERYFLPVLVADVWLLGYHHVISTYTRLAMDAESFQRYRTLLLLVPVPIVLAVLAAVTFVGVWAVTATYVYWQWWHYSRQSYGVAQLYRRKAALPPITLREQALFYALPLAGIAYRSAQGPTEFLGVEMRALPVPSEVAWALVVVGAIASAWILVRGLLAWRAHPEQRTYHAYLATHLLVFFVAYLGTASLTYGWLIINIWHNAQYVMIVWLYNNNRFKSGVHPSHRFLSTLSQRPYLMAYLGVCLALSTGVYSMLYGFTELLSLLLAPAAVVVYQSINFHHYVVDGVIWKVRRPEVQRHLGVTPVVSVDRG